MLIQKNIHVKLLSGGSESNEILLIKYISIIKWPLNSSCNSIKNQFEKNLRFLFSKCSDSRTEYLNVQLFCENYELRFHIKGGKCLKIC